MNAFSPCTRTGVREAALSELADREAIAAYVAAHPASELFHRPEWSLAVEQGCRQRARTLVAEAGGVIVGYLPLSEIRSPLFGNALVSAGFGVGGGILASDEAVAQALADSAWKLAQSLGCATAELRGGPLPAGWEARDDTYVDFARPLPSGDEAILSSIKKRQRAEVRRAMTFDLEVAAGADAKLRAEHYAVYAESVRNLGTPVFPRPLFDAMLDQFGEDADILVVRKDGEPLAAVLSFYFKGCVYPYWGGGTAEARTWRANDLLYYALMRHAAARGCDRFSFGRSKVGTGAYAFKKNWGFEPTPLRYAVRTADGAGAREVNPLNPKYRLQVALWQRMPLWLANRLGPPIARGLG